MLAVFLWFSRGRGVRYAFMLSLLWGKVVAGVHRLLGLDLPLLTLYRSQGGYGYYPALAATANMAILAFLVLTHAIAIAWPELRGKLGLHGGPFPGLPLGRAGANGLSHP